MVPRHRSRRPLPLASTGDDSTIELDVRIRRGDESAAMAELERVGARTVEPRPGGELRVEPGGPLRGYLELEHALALYAVRALPGIGLERIYGPEAFEAALELSALVMSADRGTQHTTFRVTAGPEVTGDRAGIGRLAGALGRRLALKPTAANPDLILIIRRRPDASLELSARLPLGTRAPGRTDRTP